MICSICIDEISANSIRTKCAHMFHKPCWEEYFKHEYGTATKSLVTCPVCKCALLNCNILRQHLRTQNAAGVSEVVLQCYHPEETNGAIYDFPEEEEEQEFDLEQSDRLRLIIVTLIERHLGQSIIPFEPEPETVLHEPEPETIPQSFWRRIRTFFNF